MALLDEEQETEASEEQPGQRSVWRDIAQATRHAVMKIIRSIVPAIGLFLFMVGLPLLLIAYPAYLVSGRLADYAAATTVEAKLMDIDIRTVELGQDQTTLFEARKHFDVVFYFQDAQQHKHAALVEMSWPAPGLKRKLSAQYPVGETYTLYRLSDQSVMVDDFVARSILYRMTALMALVLAATGLFFLLWKRLAARMAERMPAFPVAGAKSLMVGQLGTLVIAGLLDLLASGSPGMVTWPAYLGAYWGMVLLISLSLRLLVFAPPAPVVSPAVPDVAVQRKPGAAALRETPR